jgi:hypothetical protein
VTTRMRALLLVLQVVAIAVGIWLGTIAWQGVS